MDELNFFDIFITFILYTGYVANFIISIQLMNMPDIDRISPVALNWCLTIVFGISIVIYFYIQAKMLNFYCHRKGDKSIVSEGEKKWMEYDLIYTEFSISLFFISFVEYFAELFIAFEDITGYNQAQLMQIYIFSRIVITGIVFIFSFYLYKKRIDDKINSGK